MPRTFYRLKDTTLIEVGTQNMTKGTVPVTYDNQTIDCPMFIEEDGDIGFVVKDEEVLFHWTKTKLSDVRPV